MRIPFVGTRSCCHTLPRRELWWSPDIADHRDFVPGNSAIASLLRRNATSSINQPHAPRKVDWREYCEIGAGDGQVTTSVEACLAMVQQMECRSTGRRVQLSRAFVDHTARRMTPHSASGLSLRTVLKAIARCGVPPEKYWPSVPSTLGREPDAFAFCFQKSFRALRYFRLDDRAANGSEILRRVQCFVAGGFAVVFGFPVYPTTNADAEISFPTKTDAPLGGQAATAVGFDDKLRIRSDKSAILIRNCLGLSWGNEGYGWLPYSYVTERLAVDFWVTIKPSWLRSGEFELTPLSY